MVDLSGIPKYDEYMEMTLPVVGQKEVTRKKDGKKFIVLVCKAPNGDEVSLFDWSLKVENGKMFCLKRAYNRAMAALQTLQEFED